MLTWSQLQIWRDTNTLFTYMLELEPDCAWCHAQYGSMLGNRGHLDAALPHLIRAAELRPESFNNHANVGLAFLRVGRAAEAVPSLADGGCAEA